METQVNEKIGEGIKYNPFKIEDKHYFGSFFNLANNNIVQIFDEFKVRLNDTKGQNNLIELIDRHFPENLSIVDFEKKMNILKDYLPIIHFLNKEEESDYSKRIKYFTENFRDLILILEKLRNFYTHHYHEPIHFENADRLTSFLDDCIFKTALDAKNKYLKTDKTREALSISLKDELKELYNRKIKDLEVKKAENPKFRFSRDESQIIPSLYNEAFRDFIYKTKEGKNEIALFSSSKFNDRDFLAKSAEFQSLLSTRGLVFIISIFLTKKEMTDLMANISGFKGTVVKSDSEKYHNSLKYMATRRVFTNLCYKGLKQNIKTSQFDKKTLLMQMIDELSKVPDCIYSALDEKKKNEFIEDWNEYYKDNEENNKNLDDSLVAHAVIRKRYEDKFNYFALRYLDEFGNFPSLRFQINVGNYIHDTTTKKIGSSNVVSERVVKESLNVFGKLSEIGKLKKEFFLAKEAAKSETPFELFPNPSYNILKQADGSEANNIPIFLEIKRNDIKAEIEKEKEILHSDQNRKPREKKKPTKENLLNELMSDMHGLYFGDPTAILSLNELPSLLYELLVKKTPPLNIENSIRLKIEERFQAIKNVDLTKEQLLPKNLRKNKSDQLNIEKLRRDLNAEVSITECRLTELAKYQEASKNFERDSKKHERTPKKDRPKTMRKYVFYSSEKGEIATWLANDIKRFMPKVFKQTWRSLHHNELQRALAYYDPTNKKVALDLLESCSFDKTTFDIIACFKNDSFEGFYETYLQTRKSCFQGACEAIQNFENDKKALKIFTKGCFVYMKERLYYSTSQAKLINRILAMPAQLSRGIFDSNPTQIPNTPLVGNEDRFAKWFVDSKMNTDLQTFYEVKSYPRLYADEKERRRNEAKVNKQKIQDFYVKLMVENLLEKVFQTEEKIKLREIFQTRSERLALEAKANLQKDKKTGDSSENIRNQKFFWNKEVELQYFDGRIKVNNVKMKHLGKFKKIEKDSRVNTLISYNEEIVWQPFLPHDWNHENEKKPMNVIQVQIEEYEKIRRHELLKEIQKFEKFIYDNVLDKESLKIDSYQNFKAYILNGWYKHIKSLSMNDLKVLNLQDNFEEFINQDFTSCSTLEKKLIVLIAIRNKFAHNQFPNKNIYDLANEICPKAEDESFASFYVRVVRTIIDSI